MNTQNKFFGMRIALLISISNLSGAAFAQAQTQIANDSWQGIHSSENHVRLDSQNSKVDVTLMKEKYDFPRSIGITFFDEKGNKTEIELKALAPAYDPNAHLGHYSGPLSARSAPFVGFEIKIPLGSKSRKVIRSNEFKRTTTNERSSGK